MKKGLLILAIVCLCVQISAQDFFRENFSREKDYVILVNPTIGNIEVVDFLVKNGLLDINTDKIDFVGVYHSSQKYDFSKSVKYIDSVGIKNYHLHEVKGPLTEDLIYRENPCSDDLRLIFKNSIGVFFFGGEDIPPSVYGEENWYSETSDPGRHFFEVTFLFHLLGSTRNTTFTPLLTEKPDYLVTGFCLGMQTMNVAAGGTLYQDIPAQIYESYRPETHVLIDRANQHRNYWQKVKEGPGYMSSSIHPVRFSEHDFFGKTVKVSRNMQPLVYSHHHQSVKNVAACFDITALSMDGKVVEGIAHVRYQNVFTVQFHPEVSALYEDRAKVKFAPEDEPQTYHSMLGKKSLKFHRKYWGHITDVIMELAR
ncbi:MAG: gamma-glutamyl-gamma-aminobutyrate hydrolase family protein [Bacteroidales bacterium]|nr:gamma-glutamyl-gamma-aminobutyrate hydrolase family protein [Bacteroidales bacterium]MDT8372766.1 gamma-glutamyl-gamma-aminobutyrate hydrolase family protein [Bacteroidales bacterium]